MSDIANDESRLRATEAQMRRALGLQDNSSLKPQSSVPAPSFNGPHRSPRRFARDGEVPVSIIHRDEPSGTNQLEAARQTIGSLTAAKEHAERSLEEAHATIQHLQTELAHERLAKDEAAGRAEAERRSVEQALQSVQAELAVERAARRDAEEQLARAQEGRQEVEKRLTAAIAAQKDPKPARAAAKRTAAAQPAAGKKNPKPARRRGGPVEAADEESGFIEWWVPGWRERLG